jgi:hypothetical protein
MIAVFLTGAAVSLGTYGLGWLAVPAIGLWIGLVRVSERPVWTAAIAGSLGWSALLAWGAFNGPVAELAGVLGGVVGAPAPAIVGVTLAYPAVAAGAAAGVGSALRSLWERQAG